jgi:hypothetical protein
MLPASILLSFSPHEFEAGPLDGGLIEGEAGALV